MSYYNDARGFNSPPTRFQNQSTPKMHHHNQFQRSPYPRSPVFNNQLNKSFNSSPYHHMNRNHSNSFNSATSSPDRWSFHSNTSFSSNSSGSYFADVSQGSPSYNSPIRSNGSPHYSQNRNRRFQGKQDFQNPDSNPGHSNNIQDYVHPSMLEDPWKDLVAAMEKKA